MEKDTDYNVTSSSNASCVLLDTADCSVFPTMSAVSNDTTTTLPDTAAFPYSTGAGIAVGFTVSSVMFLIIVGNILVCVAVGIEKKLQNHQNFFLVSLAASDIMVGVLIMPFSLAYELMGYWVFGQVWCDMWLALDVFACTASIFNLCLIAIERHRCVTNPTASMVVNHRRQLLLIVGAYAAAAAISLPPLFGWKEEVREAKGGLPQCPLRENPGYVLFSIIMSFYIPLAVMIGAYVRLFCATRAQFRKKLGGHGKNPGNNPINTLSASPSSFRTNMSVVTTSTTLGPLTWSSKQPNNVNIPTTICEATTVENTGTGPVNPVNDSPSKATPITNSAPLQTSPLKPPGDNQQGDKDAHSSSRITNKRTRLVQAKERRFTLIVGLVMGAFIICWYPFFQLYAIKVLCKSCSIPDQVFGFWFWVGYCNSALNPIIYTIFNADFRRVVVRIFTCGKLGTGQH